MLSTVARILAAFCLLGAFATLVFATNLPRILLIISLAYAFIPICRAWKGSAGTALRPAIIWAAIAIGITIIAQIAAFGESVESGRPFAGQITYLSTLAVFATLISVLNARTPGGGAWAILMVLLMVVFLVPWLEASGLAREGNGWDRLRLTPPWTLFYGLLVLAGVTNFLPTRFGPSAIVLGVGFGLEYLVLTQIQWSHQLRGTLGISVCLCWSMAIWLAELVATRNIPPEPGLERLWWWFRNAWGVVWALRVQERFNRTAEHAAWPIKLTWHGVVSTAGDRAKPEIPPEAEATLAGLLRRFATAEVITQAGVGN